MKGKKKLYFCQVCKDYNPIETSKEFSDGVKIVSCTICKRYITEYKWSKK